jgi:signal transduction histidine kinase
VEEQRLQSLKRYDMLSLPPDTHFDNIVDLAARVFNVPVAMISLVDKEYIWFKANHGHNIQKIERTAGLCASAILADDVYMVEDALNDARTANNPLVAHSGLRFYAAAPLKVKGGYRLGTLCIVSHEPNKLDASQKEVLKKMAAIIVDEMELRREAKAAAEKQNQILSVAAHEMKNSLATMSAYSELLGEEGPHKLPTEQISHHLKRACSRMNGLIREMLEMAKLQSDGLRLTKTDFDIAPVIGRVAARNTVLAGAKQQKLFLDVGSNLMIHADEMRIEEIADNLINNAIKYSPTGTAINVKLEASEENIIIEVKDEGPGFTEKDKEKLFQPFSKLSARPTGGETSTGIGLALVKLLVDAHGGKVEVGENEEKGARFTVRIPVA